MLSPNEIAVRTVSIGKNKAELSILRMLLLGVFAGMFIALASMGANTAISMIENPSVQKLVAGCVFPAGLAMVVLAGGELFTGNCLLIVGVLDGAFSWKHMLKNWCFVYIGNFIGAFLVAILVVYSRQLGLFSDHLAVTTMSVAVGKVSLGFGRAILLGTLCNVLVCLAVWMSFGAERVTGKIAAVFFPVMLFVLSGTEHSVANMYYITAGLLAKCDPAWCALAENINLDVLTWPNFLLQNLLPVTIGNILGGAGLVGCLYWCSYLYRPGRKAQRDHRAETVLKK